MLLLFACTVDAAYCRESNPVCVIVCRLDEESRVVDWRQEFLDV